MNPKANVYYLKVLTREKSGEASAKLYSVAEDFGVGVLTKLFDRSEYCRIFQLHPYAADLATSEQILNAIIKNLNDKGFNVKVFDLETILDSI